MAYDIARGRAFLFGGTVIANSLGGDVEDSWEWDGRAWMEATPTATGPTSRSRHAIAYDEARARVVLFGGLSVFHLQDTWQWDGRTWRDITPTGSKPSTRSDHAMAYDSRRGRVILFAGSDQNTFALQDTWEWDGSAWTDVTPVGVKPSARAFHSMVYDGARGATVVFGGVDSAGHPFDDLWGWDGSSWVQAMPTGAKPSARSSAAMAYDIARSRIVLFGGSDDRDRPLQDTWEWDGQTWLNVTPAGQKPSARSRHKMAYDRVRRRMVLFAGDNHTSQLPRDMWEWDGAQWTELTGASMQPDTPRLDHALAYDSARGRLVLFGGWVQGAGEIDDTWEWDASLSHQPAFQFTASSASAFDTLAIEGARVRAFAGGTFSEDARAAGATLLGWSNRGSQGEPGLWVRLAANGTGIAPLPPFLPSPKESRIDWNVTTADEARRFVTERDGAFSFQVRPSGTAGAQVNGASVALDYIEVQVRYRAP
jgi:hypothetical protein